MGAWDEEPWGNDCAADWFLEVFEGFPVSKIGEALRSPPPPPYKIDEARAACYLLQVLGVSAYIWPGDGDELEELVPLAIEYLENLLDPPSNEWSFIADWNEPSLVVAAIRKQIDALRLLLR